MPPGIMPSVSERRSSAVITLNPQAAVPAISMHSAVASNVRSKNDGARRKNARLKWQARPLPISHWPIWLAPSGRAICRLPARLTVAATSNGPNSQGLGWRKRCQAKPTATPSGAISASQPQLTLPA
ncbi:hypothetical protein D3C73_1362070 [compost metagenome]